MTETELIQILALQKASKIGDIKAKKLIKYCGSVEELFKAKKRNLLKIEGIGTVLIKELFRGLDFKEAERELDFIRKHNLKCHFFTDDSYPERLKHCVDGPILLFQSGNININQQPIISIVGTRNITSHGIAFCEKLVDQLTPFNPIIVSGFAYGTDITAQKAALYHNLQTIGCLAHGLNQVYPKSHAKYIEPIKQHGGFFTDFWSTDDFERTNFLKRNRIIAGLSEATIIIESAKKGGSLVTAEIANSYNREVFAVPGRISDPCSTGCNNLIKMQRAHLLSQPEDVPYILNWNLETQKSIIQRSLFVELDKNEGVIYNFLKDQGRSTLDIIAIKINMPTFKVISIMLNLELKGMVRPLPGKEYELV